MTRRKVTEPIEHSPEQSERPSKSARKRAAHDAQTLGEQLVALSETQLQGVPLDDELRAAIRAARLIKARGGRARQLQFIGKLMRAVDPAPILAALQEPARVRAQEAERDKRINAWRERLLSERSAALDALRAWRPQADFALLAKTLDRALDTRSPEPQRLGARRELHKLLRALFDESAS